MARFVHRRLLPLLLLAACFLLRLEVSDCSASAAAASSPAEDPREPAGGAHGDASLRHQVLLDAEQARAARASMELVEYGRTGAAADGDSATSAAATPARAEGVVVVAPRPPRETTGGRAGLRPAGLLRSKLTRRLLVAAAGVEGAGTDGAGPSCHSNNVHINCPPASKP